MSQLASQYGTARGTATSKNPSFSWTAVQPRHQFPDGSSSIQFAANGESNITGVILSDSGYKVSTALGTLHGGSLNSAGGFAGELSSTAAGSTRLSITWTGQGVTKELSRSREIAFSNLDMKPKAGPGATQVLAEDRVKPTTSPENPASNPDGHHEIDPGTFAFLLPSTATNVTRTEVTIVKQFSPTTPARAKLESHGLPSLVVSTDAEGNARLSLPADWPNANAIPSTIYLHGTTDAENPSPQIGTLKLTLEVELKDDIQTAPFSNQPSTQKSWHKIVEKIGVSLLPIELRDIKDHSNSSDDVQIRDWDTSQNIKPENIAWIEPHLAANDAPQMPQLEFAVPGMPSGWTIEAKIEVKYDRGNGARTSRNQAEDTVKIPSDGSFKQVSGDTWQIWSEYQNQDFFGGEATFTYRIKSGTTTILPDTVIDFRIGGKNPDDARCRAYIETLPDSGPNGGLWFAYAVARSESKDYNGKGSRYNQFLELSAIHLGRPLFGDDPSGPGGYGLFQVTGNAASATADIPRKQIWNWQENVIACMDILRSKKNTAVNWMAQQRNADNANGVTLPNHTVRSVTFAEGTNRTMESAVTIKLYNGASRAPSGFPDNGNVPGFLLDPQGSGQYCFWRNNSSEWALSRYNAYSPPFNYVDRVCAEVGP